MTVLSGSLILSVVGLTQAHADEASLTIRLVLDGRGVAMGAACVVAQPFDSSNARLTGCADSNGMVTLTATTYATYQLMATFTDHPTVWLGANGSSQYDLDGAVPFEMGVYHAGATLESTSQSVITSAITDAASGASVSEKGTCLYAISDDGSVAGTQCTGANDADPLSFASMVVPPGSYHVGFGYNIAGHYVTAAPRERGDYEPQWAPGGIVDRADSPAVTVAVGQIVRSDLALATGGSISGKVLSPDGSPSKIFGCVEAFATDARSYVEEPDPIGLITSRPPRELGSTCSPSDDGSYTIHGLPTGAYRVVFDNLGKAATIGDPPTVHATAGSIVTGVNGVLDPAATITGDVQTPDTHIGIGQTWVLAFNQRDDTRPAAAIQKFVTQGGNFEVGGLPSGTYYLEYAYGGDINVNDTSRGTVEWHGGIDAAHATPVTIATDSTTSLPADDFDIYAPTADVLGAVSSTSLPASDLVSWSGTDVGTGIKAYDVRFRQASGRSPSFTGYGVLLSATTSKSATLDLAPGYDYCVQTRARDRAGNLSAYSPDKCVARPLDDRALTASHGWTRSQHAINYGRTLTASSIRGATLTYTDARVSRIGLVADTCSTCGQVAVYVGSTLIGTLNLTSSTVRRQQLLTLPTFSLRTGTVTLKITSSHRPVHVDGLVLARS